VEKLPGTRINWQECGSAWFFPANLLLQFVKQGFGGPVPLSAGIICTVA